MTDDNSDVSTGVQRRSQDTPVSPNARRVWRERVYASDLTGDQKVVVLALAEHANFSDGARAYPGVDRLARMCGLKERAVRYALRRAEELHLIEKTGAANGRRGVTNVYRIQTTGTAVPPVGRNHRHAHAGGPGETTGTYVSEPPARTRQTTGTAMPPTNKRPIQLPGEGITTRGTSPADALAGDDPPTTLSGPAVQSALPHQANLQDGSASDLEPPRFCPQHPAGTHASCPPCGDHRRRHKAWADRQRRRIRGGSQARAAAIAACLRCDEVGQIDLGETVVNCTHTPDMDRYIA
ncbi:helix-turn-helix domain-containing protein [Mycobacterium kyogaense]|uniref:helix-turn-helix domain-containing protein n=1 Tax=Mycobacterium kyogaense TaxID=2212479 RepID=UPI003B839571